MFTSLEFTKAWKEWKEHKAEKHGSPYTSVSEDKALSRLFKQAHGIEALAIDSIDYSIEHNWAAIYIKPTDNGTQGTDSGNRPITAPRGTSDDRVEALRNW